MKKRKVRGGGLYRKFPYLRRKETLKKINHRGYSPTSCMVMADRRYSKYRTSNKIEYSPRKAVNHFLKI